MRLCDACLLQLGGGVVCPLQMLRLYCRSGTSKFICLQLRSLGLEVAFECVFIPQLWSFCSVFLCLHTALSRVAVSGCGGLPS